jgi:hypothetical protein
MVSKIVLHKYLISHLSDQAQVMCNERMLVTYSTATTLHQARMVFWTVTPCGGGFHQHQDGRLQALAIAIITRFVLPATELMGQDVKYFGSCSFTSETLQHTGFNSALSSFHVHAVFQATCRPQRMTDSGNHGS